MAPPVRAQPRVGPQPALSPATSLWRLPGTPRARAYRAITLHASSAAAAAQSFWHVHDASTANDGCMFPSAAFPRGRYLALRGGPGLYWQTAVPARIAAPVPQRP